MAREMSENILPAGWKMCLLDSVAKRGSGHTPSKNFPEYWNGGIKWVSLSDSSRLDKGYISKTDKEISDLGIKKSSAVVHPKETVVVSRDAGVGKSAVLAEPMAVSQHFIAWQCDNECQMNSWFLYYWLQSMKSEFERQAIGSTIKTIGLPYFKKLKLGVPVYSEQQTIAKILSTWDKAISVTEQLISTARQQKKSLMQELLTHQRRLPGFDGEWELKFLGEISKPQQWATITSSELLDDGFPVYGANGFIGYYSEFNHEEETVTVTCRGSTCGEVSLIPARSYITGNSMCLDEIDNEITSYEFIYHLLTFRGFNDVISGSAQPQIFGNAIKKVKINLPPLKEQQKIAQVLTAADREIELYQQKLAGLKQEKQALMQQLLTGKRRVVV
ncbi:MAG TPA: restriction endonuclease subunit S [Scandinavium sp.]|jgi:type I restriction enzyme S subunit|uniref:restriction endonuclease subunit S n=1 Tax=Scandinavium sp. TaxID=2830653 RepID=UPI002E33E5A7|nr:restriction endonuclease subunit S [Scandinavium sp.]HEX4500706.1 restriction endonuclease subunit S [Scandinavium sp.]